MTTDLIARARNTKIIGSTLYADLADALEAKELENAELRESRDWYKRRCDLLQIWQSKMRDPERTMVCDILANGQMLEPAGDRYEIKERDSLAEQVKVLRDALEQAMLQGWAVQDGTVFNICKQALATGGK